MKLLSLFLALPFLATDIFAANAERPQCQNSRGDNLECITAAIAFTEKTNPACAEISNISAAKECLDLVGEILPTENDDNAVGVSDSEDAKFALSAILMKYPKSTMDEKLDLYPALKMINEAKFYGIVVHNNDEEDFRYFLVDAKGKLVYFSSVDWVDDIAWDLDDEEMPKMLMNDEVWRLYIDKADIKGTIWNTVNDYI